MKIVSCSVRPELAERLAAEAAAAGISVNQHLRSILEARDFVNRVRLGDPQAVKESKKGILERFFC
jgi:hypothetical protein